ncbi:MAG: SPOR domain-containing protein [Tabrizicola sp.]|nr:SPOR domain-containing protein [Tabrizicola sp.]
MVRRLGKVIAVIAALLTAAPLSAQEGKQPAEPPPRDYRGQQYVDSRGCLFLRAGTEERVIWLPRVTRAGQPICGYPPSGNRVGIGDSAAAAAAPPPKAPAAADQGQGVLVQVGRFVRLASAREAAKTVNGLGFPAQRSKVREGGTTYQIIYAGPFGSAEAAGEALAVIRRSGFADAAVVAPQ